METAMVLADSSFSLFKNTNASTKEVGEGDYEYENAL